MVYTYKRKKATQPNRDRIAECIRWIQEGHSVRQACREFNLPRATVQRHFSAVHQEVSLPAVGSPPAVPLELQAEIAVVAKAAAQHGFGLLRDELMSFIAHVVKARWHEASDVGAHLRQHCKFADFTPSNEWMTKFLKDQRLSLVKPSPLERSRVAAAADPFVIYEFYDLLQAELDRLELHDRPSHVFNIDETSFSIDPTRGKVVAATGSSSTHRITAGCGRQCFTAMACVAADGSCQSPLIIFQGKNFHSTWKGDDKLVERGTQYSVSDNGWMTSEIFTDWMAKFIKAVHQRPILMVFDGHKTHLCLEAIRLAQANGITLLKLPSHTSDRLQPLDIACFRALKQAWDKQLVAFHRSTSFRPLSKADFVNNLSAVWKVGLSSEAIKSGFRHAGIFPLDRTKFPIQVFNPVLLQRYQLQQNAAERGSTAKAPDGEPHPAPIQLDAPPVRAAGTASADNYAATVNSLLETIQQLSQVFAQGHANASSSAAGSSGGLPVPSPPSVSELFFQRYTAAARTPATTEGLRRQRIQRKSAILTHEETIKEMEADGASRKRKTGSASTSRKEKSSRKAWSPVAAAGSI